MIVYHPLKFCRRRAKDFYFMKNFRPSLCLLFLSSLTISVNAAVIGISNGTFDGQIPSNTGVAFAIDGWFEESTDSNNYSEWLHRSDTDMGVNASTVLGFSNQNGYVYSQIGTYTADEVVTISGDILQRAQLGSINNGFNLQLLSGDFPGAADGTSLAATLLATHVFSRADLVGLGIGAASSSTAYSAPFSVNLNSGTAGTDGSALWLRITRPAAGGEVFLDNLVAVSTPEPSVAFLGGGGLLALILCRRRQRA
uniref:hypothetical protein n=1 Tax=Prosthecobacter sp. TaxID=1965333 RepID=UPI003783F26D